MENKSTDEWKNAVHELLTVNFILTEENANDPYQALFDLISMEVKQALDPQVSERARKVQDDLDELQKYRNAHSEAFSWVGYDDAGLLKDPVKSMAHIISQAHKAGRALAEDDAAELRAALGRVERMTSPDNKGWASDTTRLDHAHLIAQYALGLLPHQQEGALRAALAATEGSESC